MIVIVDCRLGNLGSILNMLGKLGVQAKISPLAAEIEAADKLILPGVGSFDAGMTNLENSGLLPVLREKVLDRKTPLLGICLGMQLLTRSSEEGRLPGLGWIAGATTRFRFGTGEEHLKVPHMGWNSVVFKPGAVLGRGFAAEPRFYFVHSYHVVCERERDVAGNTVHGREFTAAVARENVYGVQFHPEKSHKFGMKLLKNFAELA